MPTVHNESPSVQDIYGIVASGCGVTDSIAIEEELSEDQRAFLESIAEPEPARLPDEVRNAIRADFPSWEPCEGLCIQCADLYRARRLSVAAAMLLPGSDFSTLGK